MAEPENLTVIWADLNAQCERFRLAYRDHRAGGTILGSIAGEIRNTINRIDTWREQHGA